MDRMLQVIAVTRQPHSPSHEKRVLEYLEPLAERGIRVETHTLPKKALEQRRFLRGLGGADLIWWHRHMLNGVIRRHLFQHGLPVLFDFDDPLIYDSKTGRISATRRRRFGGMLKRCHGATVASQYLADIASAYCDRVEVLPMAIDPPPECRPMDLREPHTLLWLGSASTQPYLDLIRQPLEQLGSHTPATLRLVAHQPMEFGKLKVDFRRWSPQEQDAALNECAIGLNPMPDTPWTRGKCPYKVLQYMAWGMPFIGSPVGENLVSSGEGLHGLCPQSVKDWESEVALLLENPDRRGTMAHAGRSYIQERHTLGSLTDQLATLMLKMVQDHV